MWKISEKKSKKIFSKKIFFILKITIKSSHHKKVEKKNFFRKIGFESLISHGSALNFEISRVALVERKSIFTILSCFKRKIFKMDPFQILSWRQKTHIFVRVRVNGLKYFLFSKNKSRAVDRMPLFTLKQGSAI